MADAFEHCARLVRAADRDRYLAALFAPAERRRLLYAIEAFDIEIAAIPLRVHEPMAGEIRLQWWRDVVAGARAEEAAASPVAAALLAAIGGARLAREPFLAALDARSLDLDRAPFATFAEFEEHAEAAAGGALRAGAAALRAEPGAALTALVRHAAAAVEGVRALRSFALEASRGRTALPDEVLARCGVQPGELFSGQDTPALRAALAEFRARARAHAAAAMELLPQAVATPARPAFLHVGLLPLYLERMEAADYAPFRTVVDVPQWRRQWRLWRLSRAP
jgi:phytoene synthase